jgi:hypothetical protein
MDIKLDADTARLLLDDQTLDRVIAAVGKTPLSLTAMRSGAIC